MIDRNQDDKEKHDVTSQDEASSLPLGNVTPEQEGADVRFVAALTDLPDEFYLAMSAQLARFARKIGVPRDLCEDVAQEALLEAVKKRGEFQGEHAVRQFCS